MRCDDEVRDVRVNVSKIIRDHLGVEREVQKRINHVWFALIAAVALAAVVMGGLIIHVAGDHFRFEEVYSEIAQLKIKLAGEDVRSDFHNNKVEK